MSNHVPDPSALRRLRSIDIAKNSHAALKRSATFHKSTFDAVRKVHKTGVIYVTEEAEKRGFSHGHPEWANFGQGAPETGPLPDAPERRLKLELDDAHTEYAPVNGLKPLREAVANYYNEFFRKDATSKYTAANVCIVPGGRAGLTRVMSSLADTEIGFFVPDYSAYAEQLGMYQRVAPIPILNDPEKGPSITPKELDRMVRGFDLGSLLVSNPGNPTGTCVRDDDLDSWVHTARSTNCLMIMDEFYSHYIYSDPNQSKPPKNPGGSPGDPPMISSAAFVDHVNDDPIVIINGLTKNWRLPGWRICWIVAPEPIISVVSSAGSYLDGGANNPLQKHAIPYLDPAFVRNDARALQAHFQAKRDYLVTALAALGIDTETGGPPDATFYVWANLRKLEPPMDDGVAFFEACLQEKVILTPGVFFDLSPRGLRRHFTPSPCLNNVRISFGPPIEEIKRGVEGIRRAIENYAQM